MKGFSLLEAMMSLAIVGVLVVTVGPSIHEFQTQWLQSFAQNKDQMQLQRLWMILEQEFQQAGYGVSTSGAHVIIQDNELGFEADLDQDGSFTSSGESIWYRWDSNNQELDRKSGTGNGSFQGMLSEVVDWSVSWETFEPLTSQVCFKAQIQLISMQEPEQRLFCRLKGI